MIVAYTSPNDLILVVNLKVITFDHELCTKNSFIMVLEDIETRDNQASLKSRVILASSLIISLKRLNILLNISVNELYILLLLHYSWSINGQGLNVREINSGLGYVGDLHTHLRRQVLRMKDLGLIDIVGNGQNSSRVFAPTNDTSLFLDEYLSTQVN